MLDPIERLQRYVLDRGIWSLEDIKGLRTANADELQAVVRRVSALPPTSPRRGDLRERLRGPARTRRPPAGGNDRGAEIDG